MKKLIVLTMLMVVFAVNGMSKAKQGENFDFSGINCLWKIVDILQEDKEPSDSNWKELFQTPGYKELMSREWRYNEKFFKKNFRIAFKPSLKNELDKQLANNNRYLKHYSFLLEKRTELISYLKQLSRPEGMNEAIKLMKRYFAKGAIKDVKNAPISFIIFDNDARGYSPIIIDVICAFKMGKYANHLFAHEMHHYFRTKNLSYDDDLVKAKHEGLLLAINSIQMEGIADQIDKHVSFFKGGDFEQKSRAKKYRERVKNTPKVIIEMNSILERMAASSSEQNGLGWQLLNKIPNSGHPTGYYMTRRIIDVLGEKILIKNATNPFAFVYLYNIAVKKNSKSPAFSNNSIEYLLNIEREYLAAPQTGLALKAVSDGLNYSGVKQFWKIVDLIEKGDKVSQEQWNKLALNPAYQELNKNEGFNIEGLKTRILKAFNPRQNSDSNGNNHFNLIKEKRKDLLKLQDSFKHYNPFEKIVNKIKPYIPEKYYNNLPKPSFSLVFFQNDLRYGYKTFIIDPLYYLKIGEAKTQIFGITYAYRYYAKKLPVYNRDDVIKKHRDVMDSLNRILLQGVPYLIEYKQPGSQKPEKIKDKNWKIIKMAPANIKSMDKLLAGIYRGELGIREAGKQIGRIISKSLRGSGVGYFMSSVIVKEFGVKSAEKFFADPFVFFRLYNQAAGKNPDLFPVFSKESVKVIEELEKKYLTR